jgi:hypothetical protein
MSVDLQFVLLTLLHLYYSIAKATARLELDLEGVSSR